MTFFSYTAAPQPEARWDRGQDLADPSYTGLSYAIDPAPGLMLPGGGGGGGVMGGGVLGVPANAV
jgi:hypothetical protein